MSMVDTAQSYKTDDGEKFVPYPELDAIKEAAAETFGFTVSQIHGKARPKDLVLARHLAMFVASRFTKLSWNEIGRCFGQSDHTTMRYVDHKIAKMIGVDPKVRAKVQALAEAAGVA